MEEDLKLRKKEIRREMIRRMAELPEDYKREADRKIFEAVLSSPEYAMSQTVFCYVGVKNEINTSPFLEEMLRSGRTVCVPRCIGHGVMRSLRIRSLSDLVPGMRNIPEPPESAEEILPEQIDLAIIPCVTANADGERLGYGGGYYDRFLSKTKAFRMLLIRSRMMREEIPREPHDLKMDAVVTEKQFSRIYVRRRVKPLYDRIYDAVLESDDGTLPEDFRLLTEEEEEAQRFARDVSGPAADHAMELLCKAVQRASEDETEDADSLLEEAFSPQSGAPFDLLKEPFEQWFTENEEHLDLSRLYHFAVTEFLETGTRERLKSALTLFRLIDSENNPKLKDAVRMTALCPDFTENALEIIATWSDPSAEEEQLLKKRKSAAGEAAEKHLRGEEKA